MDVPRRIFSMRGRSCHLYTIITCSCSISQFTYVGSAFSWSVFQSYLSRSPSSPLHDQSNVLISAIGTLLFCMIYFTPAFAQPVFAYFPRYMRTLTAGALVLAVMCLFAASFMSSAGSLIAFTGFGLGLGCGLATSKLRLSHRFRQPV
jgi:hypothetical protein